MELFKFNSLYRQVKDVFQKPKIFWFIGKWRNDPCLPVWRRGPILYPFGHPYCTRMQKRVKQIRNFVNVKLYKKGDVLKDGTIAKWDASEMRQHKLPGNLRDRNYVWNSKIRRKLRKLHLSWIKPEYHLPIWLSFHFWNSEVMWKTKWSNTDFRFEFPGHFTIVFFGLSFSVWSNWASENKTSNADWYWESILQYLYGKVPRNLRNAVYASGQWTRWDENDNKITGFAFQKDFLKKKYWPEYDKIVAEFNPKTDGEF